MAIAKRSLSEAKYLIVESMPEARQTLVNALTTLGITKVEHVGRSDDALQRISNGQYDVVLCELTINHRYDGLYLLDELRTKQLIKPSMVFMMVSAEASSRLVVSAAELSPDEYLLKPFSAEALRLRIERAFYKKQHFRLVDEAIAKKDYAKALALCDIRIKDSDLFSGEFLKLKARLYFQMGDAKLAGEIYRMILAKKPLPWAQIGLGKALFLQGLPEKAQHVFEEVIASYPFAMEAYDGLANCMIARNDTLGAQALLQKALNLSPAMIVRLRQFGAVARSNEDWERVAFAYASSIDLGQFTFHHHPLDYAQLSHAQLAQGDYHAAEQSMLKLAKVFDTPESKLLYKVAQGRITFGRGELRKANQWIDEAISQVKQSKERVSETVVIELAGACYATDRQEEAGALIEEVLLNHADRTEVMMHVELMFRSIGHEEHGKALIVKHRSAIEEMNRFAAFMKEKGDLEGAVLHFLAAVGDRPHNVTILLNAINALLAFVENNGWHENYLSIAKEYLGRIEKISPSNSRYLQFLAQYRQLLNTKANETASGSAAVSMKPLSAKPTVQERV
ncbi:response regulator [Leeia sp. TBRC 13508]|uniref:Response regulator n=1 Tax=Leeia speluncae TaxID=2884804 RepID=A0ABS8D3D6_9NEIS|nr:response regulator [Leeia speluncae]MCB6182687.1 response regulator [Leeia speluncae]